MKENGCITKWCIFFVYMLKCLLMGVNGWEKFGYLDEMYYLCSAGRKKAPLFLLLSYGLWVCVK